MLPSPNDQFQLAGPYRDVSLNWTEREFWPHVEFAVKEVNGGGVVTLIYWDRVNVLFPPSLVAFSETVNRPVVVYEWTGFWRVDVLPSPKFQDQWVIFYPVD